MSQNLVPKGWTSAPLDEVIIKAETGFACGQRDPNGVQQLRMNNVDGEGHLYLDDLIRVPATVEQAKNYGLEAGDVVFNNTNSPALVGKSAVFLTHDEPVLFSNHFTRLRTDPDRLHPKFLARLLTRMWKHRRFEAMCTRWVNQASVKRENLLSLEIAFPPLREQRRIASILDQADAIRRKRQESTTLIHELLKATFLDVFGDPSTNTKQWPTGQVQDLCAEVVDCPHSTPKYAPAETGYACLRSSDLQEGYLDWTATKYVGNEEYRSRIARLTPKAGDIVYCREGARFGNAARVTDDKKVCLGQRMMLFRTDPVRTTPEFLWAILKSESIYRQALSKVGGSASPHVNVADIKAFSTIVPPLQLQKRFSSFVAVCDQLRERFQKAAEANGELFSSLSQGAFRGEL